MRSLYDARADPCQSVAMITQTSGMRLLATTPNGEPVQRLYARGPTLWIKTRTSWSAVPDDACRREGRRIAQADIDCVSRQLGAPMAELTAIPARPTHPPLPAQALRR
jgi:hypothetical protein